MMRHLALAVVMLLAAPSAARYLRDSPSDAIGLSAGVGADASDAGAQSTLGKISSGLRNVGIDQEVPTAGEAVGKQVGVDVPNPHKYLGAMIGGAAGSLAVSFIIFGIATYFVYKWNKEAKDAGDEPHCGLWSVLCCLCCTPVTICCPIDRTPMPSAS